jgi:hypothetical protein
LALISSGESNVRSSLAPSRARPLLKAQISSCIVPFNPVNYENPRLTTTEHATFDQRKLELKETIEKLRSAYSTSLFEIRQITTGMKGKKFSREVNTQLDRDIVAMKKSSESTNSELMTKIRELANHNESILPKPDFLSKEQSDEFNGLRSGSAPYVAKIVNALCRLYDHMAASEKAISDSMQKAEKNGRIYTGPDTPCVSIYSSDVPPGLTTEDVLTYPEYKVLLTVIKAARHVETFTNLFHVTRNETSGIVYVRMNTHICPDGKPPTVKNFQRWMLHFFSVVRDIVSKTKVSEKTLEAVFASKETFKLVFHLADSRKPRVIIDHFCGGSSAENGFDERAQSDTDPIQPRSRDFAKKSIFETSQAKVCGENDSCNEQLPSDIKLLVIIWKKLMKPAMKESNHLLLSQIATNPTPQDAIRVYKAIAETADYKSFRYTGTGSKSVSKFLVFLGIIQIRECENAAATFTLCEDRRQQKKEKTLARRLDSQNSMRLEHEALLAKVTNDEAEFCVLSKEIAERRLLENAGFSDDENAGFSDDENPGFSAGKGASFSTGKGASFSAGKGACFSTGKGASFSAGNFCHHLRQDSCLSKENTLLVASELNVRPEAVEIVAHISRGASLSSFSKTVFQRACINAENDLMELDRKVNAMAEIDSSMIEPMPLCPDQTGPSLNNSD